ncbi:MAG TPA: Ig-like domain-containing protein [Candidatus Competibacter sp.]|nr:Ig-like domain-containing protein [Candidatus Competibacter sp.]
MTLFKTGLLSLGTILLGASIVAAPVRAGDIVLTVEEPAASSAYSGVANLRGWAVGSAGIDRVELYVDGAFATNVPVGGLRGDVGAQYPGYPGSRNAGFSMAFNYSNLSAGQHAIRVRAVDRENASRDASVNFNVIRFDNSYIADPAKISLAGATGTLDTRSISLKNVTADGKTYDIRLDWRTEAQGFVIAQITSAGNPPADDFSGTYRSQVSLTSNSCSFAVDSETESELKLTQDGSLLSGTESDALTVSGTVDVQGNFSLLSARLVQNSGSCRGESYFQYQGSFPSQTITIAIQREYFGSCPYSNCTASYQGTMTTTSTTTRADAPTTAAGGAPAGVIEPLLETGKAL